MVLPHLSQAQTMTELQCHLQNLGTQWQAKALIYIPYDEPSQKLQFNHADLDLISEHQPGVAALTLRSTDDPSLPWPSELHATVSDTDYRISFPVLHWGSLSAVLLLAFAQAPSLSIRQEIETVVKALGFAGHDVATREAIDTFILRSQELLVHAVEAQGQPGHVGRVSRIASSLATMLDCSAQCKGELLLAAQYHDVGLLAFTDSTSIQAQRDHPARGARLVEAHPQLRDIARLIEAHHERYDGSGLPSGLSGDELPLEAWILALAEDLVEHWEASTGPLADRLRPFFQDSTRHHHPDVVDAICGLVDSEKITSLLQS